MADYFDADGNPIDGVKSQEEVDALIQEREKELRESLAKELEEQLPKEGDKKNDKESNLANMRKIIDGLQEKVGEVDSLKQKVQSAEQSRIERAIKELAGSDENLAKQVRDKFETTLAAVDHDTEEKLASKVKDAFILAGGTERPNPMDIVGSGGPTVSGPTAGAGGGASFTQEQRELGAKFGITDDDIKKYGDKIK